MSYPLSFLSNEQLIEVYNLTKTATAIHVTEDAIIQIANDAMLKIWDKDRSILGKSLEDALPELKGQPFIDLFKKVWREGLTISGTDTPADLMVDGKVQTYYFDFEYRAIKNEDGQTLCILHTAIDVTDRFLKVEALERAREKEEALQREQALNEELAAANEELSSINEEYQLSQENLYKLNNELEERVLRRTHALAEGVKREQLINERLVSSNKELVEVIEKLRITNQELIQSQEDLQKAHLELGYSQQKLDDILLQLPSPIVVLHGPEQIIEVTNQSILSFWNKEREEVIGRPMLEVFPELKNQPFPAQWKHVLETGESIINKERPVYFNMPNGERRLSYVDYYYQPISEIDGIRSGVLATVIDVTHKVDARKQLEENQLVLQKLNNELAAINEEMTASNEELMATNEELAEAQNSLYRKVNELAASETRFRSWVEQAPIALAVFKTRELIIDLVNDKMLEIWGKRTEIRGERLAVAMPELEGQPFLHILENVFNTGQTYYGNENKGIIIRNGERIEGYFNFMCQPILDEDGVITSVLQVVNEITEQVTIRLDLQKTQQMMDLAIEAAKLGSWHIDPISRKLKYNTMLTKLLGYEGSEDMTYEQVIAQVTEEYRPIIRQEMQKAIGGQGHYDITYALQRFNDGELIWLRSLGKISEDETGEFSIFSGFVMDITELKRDEERKNDFIGMVSHELKTPLTSLNGYIQILQNKAKKANDSFSTGALDVAGKQVKKMTSMINGFLNISRLESGKIILNKSNFSLEELVKGTVEEIIMMDSSHNISIHSNEHIEIFADHDKISNVISNLLSNAVKYAPNDKDIEVKCRIVNGMAQISVRDEGMGINANDVEKLFERYYRVENNHTISGFGIGLYLSAEIIERHNGKIWAESEIGKGSTFYFSLPLA